MKILDKYFNKIEEEDAINIFINDIDKIKNKIKLQGLNENYSFNTLLFTVNYEYIIVNPNIKEQSYVIHKYTIMWNNINYVMKYKPVINRITNKIYMNYEHIIYVNDLNFILQEIEKIKQLFLGDKYE